MEVTIFLFIGVVALASSYATISRNIDEVLGATFAMVTWGIWALSAFNVEFIRGTDTGATTVGHQYQALVFLGLGAALVMLLFLVRAWTGHLTPQEETRYA